jgi:anthranilate synthase component 1
MQPPFDIAADLDTPVSTYLKLGPLRPRFLLESVEKGVHLARYSFLGFGEALEFRLDKHGLRCGDVHLPRPAGRDELLHAMRDALAQTPRLLPEVPGLPFSGGLVGATGYDAVRYFEKLDAPPPLPEGPELPEIAYVGTESLLVFDHLSRRIALLHAGPEERRQALIARVRELLRGPLPEPRTGGSEPATPGLSADEFKARVATAKEYISTGDIYQLVLSVRFGGRHNLEPFECYRALRLLNPSPYMFYCDLGDLQVVGSSPEALVSLKSAHASLRPIAGTRPRGSNAAEDKARESELLADIKENAEHVMLVDLARNDLGRVAKAGTVKVHPYRSVEHYSHVMHIVSGVQGELHSDYDAFDLFAAAFPAGTLVGAPKVRAMQLIDQLEVERRGIYGGTVGYFANNGDMDQAIAIRSLFFQDGYYSYQAGAGIVADSDPESEYQEVLAKSEIQRSALAMAEKGL